jgi:hypothetical protein
MLALISAPGFSQGPPVEPEATLELGIEQVNEGNVSVAIFTLETVIRRLAIDPGAHGKELVQGYLHRGIAFVGLAQEENAKGSFAAALQYDKGLRLSEDKFSARVVRVFEAARTGKTKSVLLPPSGVVKKVGIGAGAVALIAGGVLVVAGVGGAALATGGSTPNRPPATPTITSSPAGQALASVTKVTFSAQSSDPDGDALTYGWNFGDNGEAQGTAATHVFAGEGSFAVRLIVTDPSGASAIASTTVTARTVTGRWVDSADSNFEMDFVQKESTLGGHNFRRPDRNLVRIGPVTGTVTDPRGITFSVTVDYRQGSFTYRWEGTLDENLQTMTVLETPCQYSCPRTVRFLRQ